MLSCSKADRSVGCSENATFLGV